MTARFRHYHALVCFGIESNSNVFVITFLIFGSDLLNEHLTHFTLFPVGDVVKYHRLRGLIQQSHYRGNVGASGGSGGRFRDCPSELGTKLSFAVLPENMPGAPRFL
jgi:hypothetical protein